MIGRIVGLLVLLASATPVTPSVPISSATELVDVTIGVCYGLATGKVKLSGTLEEDTKALTSKNVSFGLRRATMDRLGGQSIGLIARSIIGERIVGEDAVALAVGGRMAGCRSILLSKTVDGHDTKVTQSLTASGWKEAPTTNAPNATLIRRMFVRRDEIGQPFLINLFIGSLPQSDFRLMMTVNAIPADVQLPQGF